MRMLALCSYLLCGCAPAGLGLAQGFAQDVDAKMQTMLGEFGAPGAAVAVTYEGKLVYTKGYGLADETANPTVAATPTTLFRVGSISKPVTALAILKLVEQGLVDLDESAFEILANLSTPGQMTEDPRLRSITVRQLLQHRSGLPGYQPQVDDPMFCGNAKDAFCIDTALPDHIAAATGDPRPVECSSIVRYYRGRPLLDDPGDTESYSNLGYCVLGRIIERRSGKTYEQFVREHVLAPAAIQRMRVGRTLLAQRVPTEARYYIGPADTAIGYSVFAPFDAPVDRQYGGFYLESLDSGGGWLASAVDLGRLVARLDPLVAEPIVTAASLDLIKEVPEALPDTATAFYGLGFRVALSSTLGPLYHRLTHEGSLAGTRAYITRLPARVGLAIVFNSRYGLNDGSQFARVDELVQILVQHRIAGTLPTADLFQTYFKPVIGTVRNEARADASRLAPGTYVTISGENLGPVVRTNLTAVGGALPTSFAGVRVRIGERDAALRYVSATEIGAIVPYGTPSGSQTVIVHSGTEQSLPRTASVTPRYPTLYTVDGTGHGTAVAVLQNGTRNSFANPLRTGDTFLVELTGTGATSPQVPDGTVTRDCSGGLRGWGYHCIGGTPAAPPPSVPVNATIGGVQASVVFAGNAYGQAAGKTLVLITVPSFPVSLPIPPLFPTKRALTVQIGSDASLSDVSVYTR